MRNNSQKQNFKGVKFSVKNGKMVLILKNELEFYVGRFKFQKFDLLTGQTWWHFERCEM